MDKKPRIFISLDEPLVIELVKRAKEQIVFVAPSISINVALAIVEKRGSNPTLRIDLIVDADPKCLRFGYGELGGLKMLEKNGIEIRCQPELRIGVLITDERALIFAPTAEIILEPAGRSTFNAINVTPNMASWLRHAIAPIDLISELVKSEASSRYSNEQRRSGEDLDLQEDDTVLNDETLEDPAATADDAGDDPASNEEDGYGVLKDDGIDESATTDSKPSAEELSDGWVKPEIGMKSLDSADMQRLSEEIEKRPPKKFDEAREILVYNGYLQFVDMKLSGGRLSARTIRLPDHLLTTVKIPDSLLELKATCRLFDNIDALLPEIKEFEQKVNDVRRCYTQPLGEDLGSVILVKDRKEFDKEVKDLRDELEDISKRADKKLSYALAATKTRIIKILLPMILRSPPDQLRWRLDERCWSTQEEEKCVTDYLTQELFWVIPTAGELIERMDLSCIYKDVTWEMLNEPKFGKAIRAKFPREEFTKLYHERNTIGERKEEKPRTVTDEDWPEVLENEPS